MIANTKMAHWRLYLNGNDHTSAMARYISNLEVSYEVNKPAIASISVISRSYLEDFYRGGREIKIKFGYSPLSLSTMFKGKIIVNPEGSLSSILNYTVTAIEGEELSREQQVNNFYGMTKSQVVSLIVGRNGYMPDVAIVPDEVIPSTEFPLYRGVTDLKLLEKFASDWNCIMRIDDSSLIKTIHFWSDDIAHLRGDALREFNISDVSLYYNLGYMTDYTANNVKRISWHFNKSESQNSPNSGGFGDNDYGPTLEPEGVDPAAALGGSAFQLKPEIMAGDKGPQATKLWAQAAIRDAVESSKMVTRKYYTKSDAPVTKKSHKKHPAHKKKGIEFKIDLNIGDPALRPPRRAKIICGSLNPKAKMSYLPAFLAPGNQRVVYVNKVTTTLSDGVLETSLEASV